ALHVRRPGPSRADDSIVVVLRVPLAGRAAVRVRVAVVTGASEVRPSGEAQISRQARFHVAVVVLEGNRIRVREARHVYPRAAAVRVDLAEVVVLHDNDDEVVEVESGGGQILDRCSGRETRGTRSV